MDVNDEEIFDGFGWVMVTWFSCLLSVNKPG